MRTVTFYSYKGGVGRSLTLANIARYLARDLGKKVFTLDLDLEAPGLHYKFLLKEPREQIRGGVVDYLHAFLGGGAVPEKLDDYVKQIELPPGAKGCIHLMPAGRVPSPEYWRMLSQVSWHQLFYESGARGIPLFLELKRRIEVGYAPDYLLIDSRTGITEIGGLATALLPDQVVCLLAHNPENMEGARAVLRSIARSPRLEGQKPVELLPVITRIPKALEEEREKKLVADVRAFFCEPAEELAATLTVDEVFVLHSEPELQVEERLLVGGDKVEAESGLLQDYLRLFKRIVPNAEREPGFQVLEPQALLAKARIARDAGNFAQAEELLRRALELQSELPDGRNTDVYCEILGVLGMALSQMGRHADAIPYLEGALKLREELSGRDDPRLAPVLFMRGCALEREGRHAEAEAALRRSIEIEKNARNEADDALVDAVSSLFLPVRFGAPWGVAAMVVALVRGLLQEEKESVVAKIRNLWSALPSMGQK